MTDMIPHLRNSRLILSLAGLMLPAAMLMVPFTASSQEAVDAMRLAKPDMKGTARFMSMGGAFGALGGDLTTLSYNPAGIGVYRSHEIGVTVDLDAQTNTASTLAGDFKKSNTPFLLNNIGGVLTLKLNSDVVPNLNFGFTYNRTASFNRKYGGNLGALGTSMTNWMAGVANGNGLTVADVSYSPGYNPYNPTDGGIAAPWIDVLGYQSYLINPEGDPDNPLWQGQFGGPSYDDNGNVIPATTGTGSFYIEDKGGIDSFNIAFGGNFGNFIYWGMDFDICNLNYTRNTYYQEYLENAYVESDRGMDRTTSDWSLSNWYNINGTGFTYKLGVILRPIQELRIGVAFHTPTYYSLSQQFQANTECYYNGERHPIMKYTNEDSKGYYEPGYNDLRFVSPWKVMVSAAGVIGGRFILSADYQWDLASKMHFKDPSYSTGYYDWEWDYYSPAYDNNSYAPVNQSIKDYYSDIHTLRVGAEFRVTNRFSIRAGYSNVSSGVKKNVSEGKETIYTAGTMTDYSFDDATNYITAGIGYRVNGFYADLAYVYKHNKSTWHAFADDPESTIRSPHASMSMTSNQFILSLGYKF